MSRCVPVIINRILLFYPQTIAKIMIAYSVYQNKFYPCASLEDLAVKYVELAGDDYEQQRKNSKATGR